MQWWIHSLEREIILNSTINVSSPKIWVECKKLGAAFLELKVHASRQNYSLDVGVSKVLTSEVIVMLICSKEHPARFSLNKN